jgi:hypothetical protein
MNAGPPGGGGIAAAAEIGQTGLMGQHDDPQV